MDTQRIKSIIGFLILVVVIGGGTFVITNQFYFPAQQDKIKDELIAQEKRVNVVAATKDIEIGEALDSSKNITVIGIPAANVINTNQSLITDTNQLQNKIAVTKIFANQQILPNQVADVANAKDYKIEDSSRYTTVDIPAYGFVNNKVDKGSIVDILLDEGNGKYSVVLSKVTILDKAPVEEQSKTNSSSNSTSTNGTANSANIQPAQPNPTTVYTLGAASSNNSGMTMKRDNPGKNDTKDYRVQLMVTETQQKSLYQAMSMGKLFTRLYVTEDQPASAVTFKIPGQ